MGTVFRAVSHRKLNFSSQNGTWCRLPGQVGRGLLGCPSSPGHLCFRRGSLPHPPPLPCRVPTLRPSLTPTQPSSHESFRTAQSLAKKLRVTLSSSLGPTACLSAATPPASIWQRRGWVFAPPCPEHRWPWRLGCRPGPRLSAETADSTTPLQPQETQAAEALGSAATPPPRPWGCHLSRNPTSAVVTRAVCECVCGEVAVHSYHPSFPSTLVDLPGPPRSRVGLGSSVGPFPWAPVRGQPAT